MRLADLSAEALTTTFGFLTGFDLFRLSHADPLLLTHELLSDNATVWQTLAPANLQCVDLLKELSSAKRRYLTQRSMRFTGASLTQDGGNTTGRGGAIEMPATDVWRRHAAFGVDLWFALLRPTDETVPAGGILIGAQSERMVDEYHAHYHQQLIHLDAQRNLFCSAMRHKPVIAANLDFDKWYHVALVFEGGSPARQRVYFQGELIDTAEGELHDEWGGMSFVQLGSGCITNGGFGSHFCGWHAFNGLVDECRMWRGALSDAEVAELAAGGTRRSVSSAECTWYTRGTADLVAVGAVSRVRCSRPMERVATDISTGRWPSSFGKRR